LIFKIFEEICLDSLLVFMRQSVKRKQDVNASVPGNFRWNILDFDFCALFVSSFFVCWREKVKRREKKKNTSIASSCYKKKKRLFKLMRIIDSFYSLQNFRYHGEKFYRT